jgi:hypothetical protein
MRHCRVAVVLGSAAAAACGAGARQQGSVSPAPVAQADDAPATPPLALAGMAALPVMVLPEYRIAVAPELGWSAAIGSPLDAAKSLDAEIRSALEERGVRAWTFPDGLEQDFKRNPTYAADPYALAEELLRAPGLKDRDRLGEPLASQLRTMVALRDNARFVLAPVDLRIRAVAGGGQGTMRLVLIDARASEIRWIGAVRGDVTPTYGPGFMAGLAARVADLVAAP